MEKAHGRTETRTIRTSTEINDHVTFPYVRQVFRLDRERIINKTGKVSHETVFGLASLEPERATPEQLLGYNRGHWVVENKLHWVRDVTFDEDRSQVRTGHTPLAMASLRNAVINLLRLAGATSIAAALRHCAYHVNKVLRLVGL